MKSKVEQQVMAAVGIVYVARKLASRTALEVYALALSAWMLGRLVWVSAVLSNTAAKEQGGATSVGQYILYAIEHTHLAVQLTLLVAAAAAIALIADAARSFKFKLSGAAAA